MTTVYRGISFQNDNGCYFTENRKVALTYAAWRAGSDADMVITREINPANVFDANCSLTETARIAAVNGWDLEEVVRFADYFHNKPKSYFVGMMMAVWRKAKFSGVEISHEEAENIVKAAIKAAHFDAIKQFEKGGARYPDGSLQMSNTKAMAWILLTY